jgi:F5/8 type C domain/Dolichyl-phosphate-mannose-protein mannosyltransferase
MSAALALLAAGLALRLLYLVTPGLDSDQAVFGLMAMHILRGELPIFQWGYHYMGTIESFVAAPLMLVFGPTRFALNLSPVLFSMLFAVSAYLFGREAAGRPTGLWALAFACFPPIYLVWTVVVARGAYSETLALGTLAAYFALRAVGADDPRSERNSLVGAGLTLGLAFWTHFNTVIYGGAILLFWLIERPRLVGRAIVWGGAAFFLASAPFWYGTILAHFDTFLVTAPPSPPFGQRLSRLFNYRLPIVLGVSFDGGAIPTLPVVAWLLVPIQLAALAATIVSALAAGEPRLRRAARLLLLITATLFLVYLPSPFSGANTQRYLVPLYTFLVIAPALLIHRLARLRPRAATALGVSLLALQVVPSIRDANVFDREDLRRYQADRAQEQRLFRTLEALGLVAVYADDYWDGARFTFDARERIVFANPFEDRRSEYLDLADGSEHPAFLFHHSLNAAAFEGTLRLAAARYTKKLVEGFTLIYGIESAPRGGAEIPIVAASARDDPIDASLATDHDAATRWTSLEPQRHGMWFVADLGGEQEIAEVTLWPRFASDTPRGLRVEISADRRTWQTVAQAEKYWGPCSWSRGRPLPSYDGWVVARFPPARARFVRLTELGVDPFYAWSIAELRVRAPSTGPAVSDPPTVPPDGRVLADPVLAARLRDGVRHWQGRVIRNFEYLRDVSLVSASDRLIVPSEDVLASGADPRIDAVAEHVSASGGDVVVSGLRLGTDAFARRAVKSLRFDDVAQRATVDLGAELAVAAVVVEHGDAVVSFPRGLVARTSADGENWSEPEPLAPRPSRPFWSDEGLVGASFTKRVFLFATPRHARFVELTAMPRHPKFPWILLAAEVLVWSGP